MLATAPGCELHVQRGPDWLLVRVKNLDLSEDDVPTLAARLCSLLEQHFTYRLVLELDDVPVLNGLLIGQLLQLYRWIEAHEGVMRVCGLSPENREVLHACHLDERLLPYQGPEEAIMGRPHPRPR
jgi:anti-anti-sigma regulatory factor